MAAEHPANPNDDEKSCSLTSFETARRVRTPDATDEYDGKRGIKDRLALVPGCLRYDVAEHQLHDTKTVNQDRLALLCYSLMEWSGSTGTSRWRLVCREGSSRYQMARSARRKQSGKKMSITIREI
jgi:hypothetical protein